MDPHKLFKILGLLSCHVFNRTQKIQQHPFITPPGLLAEATQGSQKQDGIFSTKNLLSKFEYKEKHFWGKILLVGHICMQIIRKISFVITFYLFKFSKICVIY
jgi:hypothetical protein